MSELVFVLVIGHTRVVAQGLTVDYMKETCLAEFYNGVETPVDFYDDQFKYYSLCGGKNCYESTTKLYQVYKDYQRPEAMKIVAIHESHPKAFTLKVGYMGEVIPIECGPVDYVLDTISLTCPMICQFKHKGQLVEDMTTAFELFLLDLLGEDGNVSIGYDRYEISPSEYGAEQTIIVEDTSVD